MFPEKRDGEATNIKTVGLHKCWGGRVPLLGRAGEASAQGVMDREKGRVTEGANTPTGVRMKC